MEITVDPRGNFVSCRSTFVSGNPAFGQYACDQLKGRTELHPARGPNGARMYGVYRLYFSMIGGDKPPVSVPPDRGTLQIEVPAASTTPDQIFIQFAVDAAGTVIDGSCSPLPKDFEGIYSKRQVVEPTLAAQACAALPKKGRFAPALDRSGAAVPSVQNADVDVVKSNEH